MFQSTFISKDNLAWTLILKFYIELLCLTEFYHAGTLFKCQKVGEQAKYHVHSQEEKMSMSDNQPREHCIPELV